MQIKGSKNKLPEFLFSKIMKRFYVLLVLLSIAAGFYFADKMVRTKNYTGIIDFISTLSSNYLSARKADPEFISLMIKDGDFKKLEKNRKQALERGVIINDIDGEYVPAVLEYKGKKIDVKLRLKGHMTDHLQDNKWSFRIKVKEKDETVMGMKRFSIQHPGTRGYLYEWIYHEMMKREDIIALRYKYISVLVNGKDWGIYALEENFENELIANNYRPKGPILRFNPDLYWVKRYSQHTKTSSSEEFAAYYSANPEAYREDNILKDSLQRKYYLKAIALIEGLRDKKLTVDQVFDIKRMAKFHAIIDLVGGSHSIDWSDIKYYYDPVKGKLEPVAYESFTNLNSRDLTGQYKFVRIDSSSNFKDWHSMIFSNAIFFEEYLKQLERMSKPEYLDEFFTSVRDDMEKNLAILNTEFPYKKFDVADYYKRQRIIRKIIDPPKGLHAYLKHGNSEGLVLQIAPIDALPVQIHSISVNGRLIASRKITLPSKQRNIPLEYQDYHFSLLNGLKLEGKMKDSLSVQYSLLGSSIKKEAHIFPFPHTDNEFISSEMKSREGNIGSFSFLIVDEERSTVFFKPGKCIVDKDLVIPAGYKVFADQQVVIDLRNKAKIVSYSPFIFSGTEDAPVVLTSGDSTSEGIELINAPGSVFKNVSFRNFPQVNDQAWSRNGAITFYESSVDFNHCVFSGFKSKDAVSIIRSDFEFVGCLFSNIKNDALDIDFSNGKILQCAFEDCGTGIDAGMSKLNVNSITLNRMSEIALNINSGAQLSGKELKIKNCFVAISAEDLAVLTLEKITISDSQVGVIAYKKKAESGHPEINIKGVEMINVTKKFIREKKSAIFINGVNSGEIVDNMEIFIANEKKTRK